MQACMERSRFLFATFVWLNQRAHKWNGIAAIALVVAFLVPYVHGWLHASHHDHHVEHCSPELELDACHRLLVHHDHEAHCDHDGHVMPADDTCELCGLLQHRTLEVIEPLAQAAFGQSQRFFSELISNICPESGQNLPPSRAPPRTVFA